MMVFSLLVLSLFSQVQCESRDDPPPVKVDLYYETLCPFSRDYFCNQLYPTWLQMNDIMDVHLYPFGNAQYYANSEGIGYTFHCQHGPDECEGNMIHACAQKIFNDIYVEMDFVNCMLSSSSTPAEAGPGCAAEVNKKWAPIQECVKTVTGQILLHQVALDQEKLNPPLSYVPWILVNEADFMITTKEEYNSLQDAHLAHHFRKPAVFRQLIYMGLVTPEGKVLSEREWRDAQRLYSERRIPRLLNLTLEGNLRPNPSQVTIGKDSNNLKINPKEAFLPFPLFASRKGVLGEPYLDSLKSLKFPSCTKIFSLTSAGGTPITKCRQVWERLCPPPKYNLSVASREKKPYSPAKMKLQYLGKNGPVNVLILQHPIGSNRLSVFNGRVAPGEEINLKSCRVRGAPFTMVLYEDGMCTCRVNTCCEKRYCPGRKIGGPSGHFLVKDLKGGQPCERCKETSSSPTAASDPPVTTQLEYRNALSHTDESDDSETDITQNSWPKPMYSYSPKQLIHKNVINETEEPDHASNSQSILSDNQNSDQDTENDKISDLKSESGSEHENDQRGHSLEFQEKPALQSEEYESRRPVKKVTIDERSSCEIKSS